MDLHANECTVYYAMCVHRHIHEYAHRHTYARAHTLVLTRIRTHGASTQTRIRTYNSIINFTGTHYAHTHTHRQAHRLTLTYTCIS